MESPNGNKETMDELGCKRKRDASESGGKEADGRDDAGKLEVSEGGSKRKGEDGRVDDGEVKVSDGSKGKDDDGKAEMPSQAEGENTESDDADKLIACKTCFQTYHVKCVSLSSLEFIPEDWECLNCSDDIDFLEPLMNFKMPKKNRQLKNKCYICSSGKKRLIIIPQDKDVNSLLKSTSTPVVESDENGTEDQEDGTGVSDPGMCRAILKKTLDKINNNDKLLMISEACSKSEAEELMDKSVEKSNKPDAEKGATTQQSDQERNEAFQAKIERFANVRKMQREKMASKTKNEVTVASNSTAVVIQKKSSDIQTVEKDDDDEGVAMMIDPKNTGKAGLTGNSASKGLISGQDNTPPNTSSHLKNVSASGSSNPRRRPKSILEGADTRTKTAPTRRPWLLVTKPRSKSAIQKQKAESESEPEPVTTWHDYELDALWIGVRRHGLGNWERILEDSSLLLGISCKKTPEDLSKRWEIETQRIFPSAVALPLMRNTNNNVVVPNPNNTITTDQRQPQPHQNALMERNNNNSGGGYMMMMVPAGSIVPHNPNMPAGITWYPCAVENQGIMWMPLMSNAGGPSNVLGFSSSPSMVSQMAPAIAPQSAPTPGGPFFINGSSSSSLPKDSQKAPTSTPQREPTQVMTNDTSYIQGTPSSISPKVSKKARTSASRRAPKPVITGDCSSSKVSHKAPTSTPQRALTLGNISYIQGSSSSSKKTTTSAPLRASSSPMISDGPSFIQTPLPSSSSSKVSKAPAITPQKTPATGDPYVLALPAPSSKVSQMIAASSGPQTPRTPPPPPPLPSLPPSGTSSMTSLLAAQILAAAAKTTERRNSNITMIPNPLSLQGADAATENENNNEPKLLLGGCFTLPKFVVLNKKKKNNNDVIIAAANNKNEKAKDKDPKEHSDDHASSSSE